MKFEKYFFYGLILVHLLPVILLPYFVTHDGPAHVYNANLIQQLIFVKGGLASFFFEFNPQVLPNWISHLLLGLFNQVVDPAVSERIVIGIYIIAFPLSFRALILAVNPRAFAATYLIFPYVQAFSILTGLYSFCLGLCLMFYVLYKWQRSGLPMNRRGQILFSIWLVLIYFSHLFVFMLAMLSLGFMISWKYFSTFGPSIKRIFENISLWWKEFRLLLLVSLIPLFLTFLFAFHQASKTDSEIPEFDTMLELFIDVRPIIALNYDMEKVYSKPLFFVYLILLLAGLVMKIRSSVKHKQKIIQIEDGWLILSGIMTIFYFFLPDDIFSGGIVAIRFCLMSYLFLIIWLSAYSPRKLMVGGAVLSVIASCLLLNQRQPALRSLSNDAVDFVYCKEHIDSERTLLTLNYSDNWMLDNIASYIADDKNILLLDNYEANQVHFPLIWKKDRDPDKILGNSGKVNRPCIDLRKYKSFTGMEVDYILVMKRPSEVVDSCTLSADEQLRSGYREIFVSPKGHGVLYKRLGLF